jgi:predicted flap endonuclease-1-like 5' DNA nuclease
LELGRRDDIFPLEKWASSKKGKKTAKNNCRQFHGGHRLKKGSDLTSIIGNGKNCEGVLQKNSHIILYYEDFIGKRLTPENN